MKIADEVTEEIKKFNWDKVTVCKGFNDERNSPPPVPISNIHEAFGKNGLTMLK